MKKRISGKKLSRSSNGRKQLMRSLIGAVVEHGAIVTTEAKAQFLQPTLEKLVTKAKEPSLNSFRLLVKRTGSVDVAKKLLEYGKLFANRSGGYTRRVKMGHQAGDNTQSVYFEFVEKFAQIAPVVTKEETKKEVTKPKNAPAKKAARSKKEKSV